MKKARACRGSHGNDTFSQDLTLHQCCLLPVVLKQDITQRLRALTRLPPPPWPAVGQAEEAQATWWEKGPTHGIIDSRMK